MFILEVFLLYREEREYRGYGVHYQGPFIVLLSVDDEFGCLCRAIGHIWIQKRRLTVDVFDLKGQFNQLSKMSFHLYTQLFCFVCLGLNQ